MSYTVACIVGVAGAAMLVRWCVKEVGRVNSELDEVRSGVTDPNSIPKLKRDPKTGEYRPG